MSFIIGEIAGIEIGTIFQSRIELSKSGIHGPLQAGIWGRQKEGACSIVLSGGYEDDIDNLDYILYTGAGGRDSNLEIRLKIRISCEAIKLYKLVLKINTQ